MKRILLVYILFLIFSIPAMSLSPFNFSWYALDNTGQVLPNESASLNVKIKLMQGTSTLYEETHTGISTDQFAFFTIRVGTGTTFDDLSTITAASDIRIYAEIQKGGGAYVLAVSAGLSSVLARVSGSLWSDIGGNDIARIVGTGSNLMTIKSTGDVGIGTATPSAMLDIQPSASKNVALNIGKLEQNGQKAITLELAADTDGDIITGIFYKLSDGTGHIRGNRINYAISSEIESDATYTYPTSIFPITNVIMNLFKTNTDVPGQQHGILRGMRNHTILDGDRSTFTSISNWLSGDGNQQNQSGMYNYGEISGSNSKILGISNSFKDGATLNHNQYYGLKNFIQLYGSNTTFWGHNDNIQLYNASNIAYSLYSIDGNVSTGGTIYGVYINYDDTDLTRWGIYQAGGSTNFFNGNVGIGTNTPARKLHVSDVMRLEPRATAPSSPSEGDMYMDSSSHKLRVFDGTNWQNCW